MCGGIGAEPTHPKGQNKDTSTALAPAPRKAAVSRVKKSSILFADCSLLSSRHRTHTVWCVRSQLCPMSSHAHRHGSRDSHCGHANSSTSLFGSIRLSTRWILKTVQPGSRLSFCTFRQPPWEMGLCGVWTASLQSAHGHTHCRKPHAQQPPRCTPCCLHTTES